MWRAGSRSTVPAIAPSWIPSLQVATADPIDAGCRRGRRREVSRTHLLGRDLRPLTLRSQQSPGRDSSIAITPAWDGITEWELIRYRQTRFRTLVRQRNWTSGSAPPPLTRFATCPWPSPRSVSGQYWTGCAGPPSTAPSWWPCAPTGAWWVSPRSRGCWRRRRTP